MVISDMDYRAIFNGCIQSLGLSEFLEVVRKDRPSSLLTYEFRELCNGQPVRYLGTIDLDPTDLLAFRSTSRGVKEFLIARMRMSGIV
jgi:hypothetical protein